MLSATVCRYTTADGWGREVEVSIGGGRWLGFAVADAKPGRYSRSSDCEAVPPHVGADAGAMIRAGAVAPLLDYLTERADQLPERLNRMVERAVADYRSAGG